MGLGSTAYVPMLKARNAEIKGLLKAPKALDVTPLFELQRAPKPSIDRKTGLPRRVKSAMTDASLFFDDIALSWDAPAYVDLTRVASHSERATWWTLLNLLNNLGTSPVDLIPVLLPTDDAAIRGAAADLASVTGRAALRVLMPTVRMNPSTLTGAIATVAAEVGVAAANVDVILDWADTLEQWHLDMLQSDTMNVINAVGTQRGAIITTGTPNSEDFVQVGDWSPARREWWLWLRLAHAGVDTVFGDYALYPPADPVPVQPQYGHLRYSSGDLMHVHRRAIPTAGGGLAGAFKECCTHLLGQGHWMYPGFSSADQRIHDIANDADKESLARGWREIAVQHHFALVNNQLQHPPAAPPPGTL